LDDPTIALWISIGTGVPWLLAVYSEDRARQPIENTVLGMAGTALAACAFRWISPTYGLVCFVFLGPVAAFLTIAAGRAVRRAIQTGLSRSRRVG
jgi:hypothetical protein